MHLAMEQPFYGVSKLVSEKLVSGGLALIKQEFSMEFNQCSMVCIRC